ncbi:conjugative transposon protein TraM [Cloacibacterium normanense]|uniref:conjugative transposon protein TraM n=1 Tax=Cloacibacterium normanense TaxID=237258 RepID=UPI00391C8E5C
MDIKKINFKQPKYIIPLIALPFILFFGYQGIQLNDNNKKADESPRELSTSLGETQDSILAKNDAYEVFFEKNDDRTMLDGLDKEQNDVNFYSDNLDIKQKRYIDSLKSVQQEKSQRNSNFSKRDYYNPSRNTQEQDDQRSVDIIRMLNEGSNANPPQSFAHQSDNNIEKKDVDDPVKILRKQMLLMDSLERSRDPKFQEQYLAQKQLKLNQDKMNAFLNTSLSVKKAGLNHEFNTISNTKEISHIKAVIDENSTSYLGSRIRIRLLEDVKAGNFQISKGSILYGQISGFSLQRVNLNIVSVLCNGKILPINLSVFDVDGIQGLYVPQSAFREMMRSFGTNSVQGTTMQNGSENFFKSVASELFTSASQTISNVIRKNKTKLKFNTYLYLINEKELKQDENNPTQD